MAILTLDTLSGCSSIPSFLGGLSDTPANPSKTVFQNTTAPVGWAKTTIHDNKALRVVGGLDGSPISVGGTVGFSTIFSPKTGVISSGISTSNVGIGTTFTGYPLVTNPGGASLDATTLSLSQIGQHNHAIVSTPGLGSPSTVLGAFPATAAAQETLQTTSTFIGPSTPSPGAHGHPISGPITSHTHPITETAHNHPLTNTGPHSHTFTLNQDFSILYVDIIIATKS